MVSPNGYTQWGFCIGERSEAVNCERSEQEGEEIYFHPMVSRNGFTQWLHLMGFLHWGVKRGSEL